MQGSNLRPHECESCALTSWANCPWCMRSPLLYHKWFFFQGRLDFFQLYDIIYCSIHLDGPDGGTLLTDDWGEVMVKLNAARLVGKPSDVGQVRTFFGVVGVSATGDEDLLVLSVTVQHHPQARKEDTTYTVSPTGQSIRSCVVDNTSSDSPFVEISLMADTPNRCMVVKHKSGRILTLFFSP